MRAAISTPEMPHEDNSDTYTKNLAVCLSTESKNLTQYNKRLDCRSAELEGLRFWAF